MKKPFHYCPLLIFSGSGTHSYQFSWLVQTVPVFDCSQQMSPYASDNAITIQKHSKSEKKNVLVCLITAFPSLLHFCQSRPIKVKIQSHGLQLFHAARTPAPKILQSLILSLNSV
jgi:hypothetical protein